ncbi:MAG: GtrA family protein, partial [Bacteroidaceae bacterium]|nr:GtrA family protein [Bacteroidaceae bacterium]
MSDKYQTPTSFLYVYSFDNAHYFGCLGVNKPVEIFAKIVRQNFPKFLYRIIHGASDNTIIQLFRYFWVGGIAFAVDYVTLYALTEFVGMHHLLSAAIAFLLGLVVNYLLSTSWVFSRHSNISRYKEFLMFGII